MPEYLRVDADYSHIMEQTAETDSKSVEERLKDLSRPIRVRKTGRRRGISDRETR